MTRTLTALIAALAVTAALAIDIAPAQADTPTVSGPFLSSGHTTGSNGIRGVIRGISGPISGGTLGSGR